MTNSKNTRLTIGVLSGWQAYAGTLHSFLSPIFDGIKQVASDNDCNLLLACGVSQTAVNMLQPALRPAWFTPSPNSDFVPVGPWNTDGLIVITPLLSEERSQDIQQVVASGHPVVFIGHGEDGPIVSPVSEKIDVLQIVDEMNTAVSNQSQRLLAHQIHASCKQLVDSFLISVNKEDETPFYQALNEVLQLSESVDENLNIWSDSPLILKSRLAELIRSEIEKDVDAKHKFAGLLLDHALVTISKRARQQHSKHIFEITHLEDQLELVSAQFFAAWDEARIYELLQQHASLIGTRRIEAVLFEATEADSFGGSRLQTKSPLQSENPSFSSRCFPPDGLYENATPFCLALLPLVIQEGDTGFIAFDANQKLGSFASITRQLAAALRSARLYHDALEGRRVGMM